jgi:signal transduction histidine kinase/DNA-binding NarL/FixJ family response regulator
LHGGRVEVESQLGQGTTFTVSVPYGTNHLAAEKIAVATAPRSVVADASPYVQEALRWLPGSTDEELQRAGLREAGNEDLTNLFVDSVSNQTAPSGTVLLVDDNRDMREYLQRLLARKYHVIPAQNGSQALELALTVAPDLILTDVMMPEMDGFELLKGLRSDPRTMLLPVIMLSARAGEEARSEGMEAGADDYLIKPFTARELMARVGAHLSMKRLREELNQREQSERGRAETAETQYRKIVESISEGFIFVDSGWSIRYVNEVFANFAHRSPKDLIGTDLWKQFPEAVFAKLGMACREALATQKELEVEDLYEPLHTWFRVHIYPSAEGLSMFVADVTAQRRQREALLVSEKLATAGRLASTVAHEINNPLESVINLLYLARTADKPEEKDQYLGWAEREINRVAHIARQTLGFYRESAQVAAVYVSGVIESLLQVYQGKLRAKKISVAANVDDNLHVTARIGELNQVLSNLITNAIDASATGGHVTITASARTAEGHDEVEILVVDDGVGIPDADMSQIFEPFFTTKKDVGTGLGLWVVKQIVEGYQGTVHVESHTDAHRHGTTVRLVLPGASESGGVSNGSLISSL